jgi:2-polyprenyl-3-methyl-5-hydroxy-6-metoxy-1,4-benzoquinol methylase
VDPTDLIVHAVGPIQSEVLAFLDTQGVSVTSIQPFDERSPHCNKISGALSLAEGAIAGLAVLTDTDVVVLEDPRSLSIPARAVASKIVDRAHPGLPILETVFTTAGLTLPPLVTVDWHPEESTVAGNGNGGLYIVPGAILSDVAHAWERWARWLLERIDILGQETRFVDQVAMVMAMAAEGVEAFRLDPRWNFPTHRFQRNAMPKDAGAPAVMHYHEDLNPMGLLTRTGVAAVDGQIDKANAAIGEIWHEVFPNSTFWEWRYTTNPELGSGVGSRGKPLEEKRDLLSVLVDVLHPASVLDVGCGDGEATKGLSLQNYVGLDLSPEAVRRAASGNPDGDFRVGTLSEHSVEAELTLCQDVLIHEANPANYADLVDRLLEASTRALLISGYERPPDTNSPMVHFHEPLSSTIVRLSPQSELYPLREVHGITTILVLKPPTHKHRRDYTPETLSQVAGRQTNPLRLIGVRTSAWDTVGFFPDHAPRLWEYPMTADLVMSLLQPGSRIVDIGAGINPLVPYLTARGYEVDTVDPSSKIRTWPRSEDWNEWGFLDYAQAGFAHHSWNCTLDQLPPEERFDGAYCLSVIEHLPGDGRRSLLGDIAQRINQEGVVILTVDLVRGKDDLWNRSQGQTVEPRRRHGRLKDVISEGRSVGLEAVDVQTVRDWGDVPVDIGLIVMKRGVPARAKVSLTDRLTGRKGKSSL